MLSKSTAVMDSVAVRFSRPIRCPYTSLVIVSEAWPRTSDTTQRGVSWASMMEAAECLSS